MERYCRIKAKILLFFKEVYHDEEKNWIVQWLKLVIFNMNLLITCNTPYWILIGNVITKFLTSFLYEVT